MARKMSRRKLLKSAVTVAAATAIPEVVLAQIEPKKRPVVGSGEHTYEVYHDWLTPPANLLWGDTHGLAVDSKKRIYVAHTVNQASVSTNAVVVYDEKGKFIESWGSEYRGGAHGLDVRKEGSDEFLYHCDTRRRVVAKTTLRGDIIWEKGYPVESGVYASQDRYCPTNVAFAPNGDLYVGDGYGSSYVHRYKSNGDYVGIIARPGSEKGLVNSPHGLWVDSRDGTPKLAVADRSNRRIQVFTLDGQHISFVTEGMRLPCHMKTNGDLMLVPDLESVITILDKNNKVVASLGDGHPSGLRDVPRDKFIPGKFVHPHTALWVNKTDILVAEWVPIGRLTLLKKVGA